MKLTIESILNYTYILATICITISCNENRGQDKNNALEFIIEKNLGQKLNIPDNLSTYRPFHNYISDSNEIVNSKYKVYTHINTSCATCVRDIILWDSLAYELKKYMVPVILICDSNDEFESLKFLNETGRINKFAYPFFIDKKNKYLELNKFMAENIHLETVLTDKNNTILLMGNPIYSRQIKELLIDELEKRSSSNI